MDMYPNNVSSIMASDQENARLKYKDKDMSIYTDSWAALNIVNSNELMV